MNFPIKKQAGFTLFELLLVVFLVGIFYTISINTLQNKKTETVKTSNLKEFLSTYKPKKLSSLICFDNCKECVVLKDTKEVYREANSFTSDSVEVLDFDGELKKIEFPKFYYDGKFKDVCLRFDLFGNGGNSSFIIKDNDKFTFYETYFNNMKTFDSEDDVVDFMSKKRDFIPTSIDDFSKETLNK